MMESRRKELLEVVHKILHEHPAGVREYDFLLILRDLGLPIFSEMTSGDSLQMFRAHFILFHLLYCLRDLMYHEKKGSLEIHCLKPQRHSSVAQLKPARTGERAWQLIPGSGQ